MESNNDSVSDLLLGLRELQACRIVVDQKITELRTLIFGTQWIEELIGHLEQVHVKVPDLHTPETRQLRAIANNP